MKETKGAVWVPYDYGLSYPFADVVQERDQPIESKLLGPDGRPLRYARQPMGFDLRPVALK